MISLVSALLSLSKAFIQYLNNKKLIDAGTAQAVSENLQASMDKIRRARDARRNASVSMPDDPRNRDRR